jgi:hypothetical protein
MQGDNDGSQKVQRPWSALDKVLGNANLDDFREYIQTFFQDKFTLNDLANQNASYRVFQNNKWQVMMSMYSKIGDFVETTSDDVTFVQHPNCTFKFEVNQSLADQSSFSRAVSVTFDVHNNMNEYPCVIDVEFFAQQILYTDVVLAYLMFLMAFLRLFVAQMNINKTVINIVSSNSRRSEGFAQLITDILQKYLEVSDQPPQVLFHSRPGNT